MTTKLKEAALCCVVAKDPLTGEKVRCTRKVKTNGRCQPHYRYLHRHGVDNPEPLRQERGSMGPLSLRITAAARKELEKRGNIYRVGSEVIEDWARQQAEKRKRSA